MTGRHIIVAALATVLLSGDARADWNIGVMGNRVKVEGNAIRPWNPRNLGTKLACWFDASDNSTVFDAASGGSLPANGAAAKRIEDKSGNARHATEGTNPPLRIEAAQNGRAVLRFDGTNDRLLTGSFAAPAGCAIYVVAKAANWSNPTKYSPIASQGYQNGAIATRGVLLTVVGADFADWKKGDYALFGSGYTATQYPRAVGPAATGENTWRIVGGVAAASLARLYVNGATASSRIEQAGTIASVSGGLYIGAIEASLDEWWNGDIGEVVYCGAALSDRERQKLEGYLGHKWGLASSLPVGHPWKGSAP